MERLAPENRTGDEIDKLETYRRVLEIHRWWYNVVEVTAVELPLKMLKKGWEMNAIPKPILYQIKAAYGPQQHLPHMEMLIQHTQAKRVLRPKAESPKIRESSTGEDVVRGRKC
jgi:hypothetical protein